MRARGALAECDVYEVVVLSAYRHSSFQSERIGVYAGQYVHAAGLRYIAEPREELLHYPFPIDAREFGGADRDGIGKNGWVDRIAVVQNESRVFDLE